MLSHAVAMTLTDAAIVSFAQRWAEADPDLHTRTEALQLLASGSADALRDCFGTRLTFGTAGLRGALGCGPNRMNRLVVRQSAAGLGRRLLAEPGLAARGVVIGFDARTNSDVFASDSARVLAALGIRVQLFRHVVPTPVLAFAVTDRGAAAGVQVTASHNPPQDNGYKVYWGDGPQIVSPLDEQIAAEIDAVVMEGLDPTMAEESSPRIGFLDADLIDRYHAGVALLDRHRADDVARQKIRIVYTALHGVGGADLLRVLGDAGFTEITPVSEQFQPDPSFPTVAFPNPEEPGALDLAFAEARSVNADLIIANDPDADRLSLAVPDPESSTQWRQLRGDEVGWLLADHLLTATADRGPNRLVATTIVSSSLLETMAARHGVQYSETLTGFKWLARNVLAHPELEHVLSYEEALGYSVGSLVLDKDGLSAALVAADLAAALLAEGSSLQQRLSEIEAAYGRYDTGQQSIRFDGTDASEKMGALMDRLRSKIPLSVCGVAVTQVRDMAGEVPPADVVMLKLGSLGRITVRPSGTEPKCKIYYEVVSRGAAGSTSSEVSTRDLRDFMSSLLGVASD